MIYLETIDNFAKDFQNRFVESLPGSSLGMRDKIQIFSKFLENSSCNNFRKMLVWTGL